MAQPSTQDLSGPFDPTAYESITGAQLLQYLTGAYPGTNVGLVITTTDTIGNPNVPDANTNTKWQKYIWQRISPTNNSITLYVWNPNAASDVTYLYWVPAFAAAIGAGTIQGYQIAANTVTDGNIANVNWSKITNAPTSLPPSGAAGPTLLSGTYPDPSIVNGGITSAMIAQNAITGGATGKIATGANGATLGDNLAPTAGSTLGSPTGGATPIAANDRVVINAAKTGYCTVQKVIDALAEPAVGDAGKVVQVNNGGTGFQYATRSAIQTSFTSSTTTTPCSGNITDSATHATTDTGMTAATGLTAAITPTSNSSFLLVEAAVSVATTTGSAGIWVYLFSSASGAAPIAAQFINVTTQSGGTSLIEGTVQLKVKVATPGTSALTFSVYFGQVTSGTGKVNNKGETSYIQVTEFGI